MHIQVANSYRSQGLVIYNSPSACHLPTTFHSTCTCFTRFHIPLTSLTSSYSYILLAARAYSSLTIALLPSLFALFHPCSFHSFKEPWKWLETRKSRLAIRCLNQCAAKSARTHTHTHTHTHTYIYIYVWFNCWGVIGVRARDILTLRECIWKADAVSFVLSVFDDTGSLDNPPRRVV